MNLKTDQNANSYQVAAMALASSTGFVTPADVAAALAAGNIDCSENAAPGLTPADVLEKQAAFAAAAANLIDPAYFVGSEPAAKACMFTHLFYDQSVIN